MYYDWERFNNTACVYFGTRNALKSLFTSQIRFSSLKAFFFCQWWILWICKRESWLKKNTQHESFLPGIVQMFWYQTLLIFILWFSRPRTASVPRFCLNVLRSKVSIHFSACFMKLFGCWLFWSSKQVSFQIWAVVLDREKSRRGLNSQALWFDIPSVPVCFPYFFKASCLCWEVNCFSVSINWSPIINCISFTLFSTVSSILSSIQLLKDFWRV